LILLPFIGRTYYWIEKPPYGLKDERFQKLITKQIEESERGGGTNSGTFRTYAKSFRQLQHLVALLRKTAHKVQCPALIMHSKEDSWTTPWNAEELWKWLGSTDKEIHWLTGCDHVMTIDLKKREVAERLGQFAAKVSWLHGNETKCDIDRDWPNSHSDKMCAIDQEWKNLQATNHAQRS
jgi:carboxylesterase